MACSNILTPLEEVQAGNQEYHVHLGDCIPHMAELPAACMDLALFSPPFPSVYAYSSSEADLGNVEDHAEAKLAFSFFYRQLARVVKPGRVIMVHVMQIPRMKRAGGKGTFDFRGWNIRLAERAGLVFDYDWVVRRNPQSQAIKTKSHSLQFAGLERDRVQSRGVLADYLLKFFAPGTNETPVVSEGDVSRNDWIEWAECTWTGIKETETLNTEEARGPEDTKHICPLQLGIINRVVRLYTNPEEVCFSPFAGIGSELYTALLLARRAYGTELKPEYHATAIRNCERAILKRQEEQRSMFDGILERNAV